MACSRIRSVSASAVRLRSSSLAFLIEVRLPRIAGWRHAQRIAHDAHRPVVPLILDLAKPHFGGSEKMATVFFKMSRSIRRRSFSRRRREISAAGSRTECGADAGVLRNAGPKFRPPRRQLRSIDGARGAATVVVSPRAGATASRPAARSEATRSASGCMALDAATGPNKSNNHAWTDLASITAW
jgi:hypothetical protein